MLTGVVSRAVFVALLWALVACACKRPPVLEPAPAPTNEGETRYTFLFDPANPALHLPAEVKFDRPEPLDIRALPVYPPRALAAGDGPHHEVVRIVIDAEGNVGHVGNSPLGSSDAGPFGAEYREAVQQAVVLWRFAPGVLRHLEPGRDIDGDGRIDYTVTTSIEPVSVYYDVRFTFEIVNGAGVVKQDPD